MKKYISLIILLMCVSSLFPTAVMAENNDKNNTASSIESSELSKVTTSSAVSINANIEENNLMKNIDDNLTGNVINPEFEKDLSGWETTGTTSIVSWNGDWGNNNKKGCLSYGYYTGEGTYETDTHQTIKNLENGKYEVRAYSATSGNQEELYLYGKDFGSDEIKKCNITDTKNFRLTMIEVEVTNNELTIGFHAKGKQEEWANFDSVSLKKVEGDKNNYLDVIKNYTFNDGLENWKLKGDKKAVSIDNENGSDDNKSLRYECNKPYEIRTEQTIKNLKNGYYKLIFYAKSSGNQDSIYAYAKDTGNGVSKTNIPVDDNFRKVVVDFKVTNNKATIGFYSKCDENCWSEFDSVKLLKVPRGFTLLKGGDLTELNYVESCGAEFKDADGNKKDPFEILSENGFNIVRLRVYNKTGRNNGHIDKDGKEYYLPEGYQDKDDMLKLAKRAKDANMQIELTLHYSDWWTNGQNQDIPLEWKEAIKGMDEKEAVDKLEQLVYDYTKDVMISLKNQNTIPEYISLGNEMQGGLLYPYGKTKNMEVLARFLNAGSRAVREVSSKTKIILHLDEAGDNNRYYKLLDGCEEYNVDYDIIGPSYYPFWTRNSVEQIIPWCNDIYKKYNKKILFMETGYKWNPTLYNSDSQGQLSDNGNETHASSPQGQKEFMDELFNGIRNADDNCILGDLYWDPIMINQKGVGWAIEKGESTDGKDDKAGANVVSNTTLFDFNGKALKSLESYKDSTEGSKYGALSAVVLDQDNKEITNTNITININGKKYKKVTDKYGRFLINNIKLSKTNKIKISVDGYKEFKKNANFEMGETTEVKVKLKEKK